MVRVNSGRTCSTPHSNLNEEILFCASLTSCTDSYYRVYYIEHEIIFFYLVVTWTKFSLKIGTIWLHCQYFGLYLEYRKWLMYCWTFYKQILGELELCLSMRFFSKALISGASYCTSNQGFSRNTSYRYKMHANGTNGFGGYWEEKTYFLNAGGFSWYSIPEWACDGRCSFVIPVVCLRLHVTPRMWPSCYTVFDSTM